jgi:fucose 4-O-acetylase-like acetyltransferase
MNRSANLKEQELRKYQLDDASLLTMRDLRFDTIRGLAILMVLVMHSATLYASSPLEKSIGIWLTKNSRPCMAIFFFLAGYFFYRESPDGKYLRGRCKRIIIPYLVFSSLVYFYQYRSGVWVYILSHIGKVFFDFMTCNAFGEYWFVFSILFSYLLGYFALASKQKDGLLFGTIFFGIMNLLHAVYYPDFVNRLPAVGPVHTVVELYNLRLLLSWPFYFFLGLLFRRYNLTNALLRDRNAVIFYWIFLFLIYNAVVLLHIGNIPDYCSVVETLYSIAMIMGLMLLCPKSKYISIVGQMSYTIYLAHLFFVFGLRNIGWRLDIIWPYWFFVVSFIVSLLGPVLICLLGKKVLGRKSKLWLGY